MSSPSRCIPQLDFSCTGEDQCCKALNNGASLHAKPSINGTCSRAMFKKQGGNMHWNWNQRSHNSENNLPNCSTEMEDTPVERFSLMSATVQCPLLTRSATQCKCRCELTSMKPNMATPSEHPSIEPSIRHQVA